MTERLLSKSLDIIGQHMIAPIQGSACLRGAEERGARRGQENLLLDPDVAEQQRQANMDLIAKREAMQENILKAQQELALEQAYKSQMISLEKTKHSISLILIGTKFKGEHDERS